MKKVSKECEAIIGGQTVKYEEKELYPKSNCFGIWAWSISNYEKAVAKFNELNSEIKK